MSIVINDIIVTKDINADCFTAEYQNNFYQYWLSLKGNNFLPDRKDFNPNKVLGALQSMLMMDVVYDPLRFKIRLFGTEVLTHRGVDVTGEWLHELEETNEMVEGLKAMVDDALPVYIHNDMGWMGKKYIKYTSLVLPFSSDGENVNIIMSSNHFFK